MYKRVIEGTAAVAAIATAAGAAMLTVEIARNHSDDGTPDWRRAIAKWGGENPDAIRRDVMIAAATGAVLGLVTYQGIRLIGRSEEGVEQLDMRPM